jgi:hypothetical protein
VEEKLQGEVKGALFLGGRGGIWFLWKDRSATPAHPGKSRIKVKALDWLSVEARERAAEFDYPNQWPISYFGKII